eukprot:CAMPEP_0117684162 /NCGR_PEP_ID=MMETSP0804-20121206/20908_1 /TAXON_ID=1074897 /ORGANISM="Tetraselmis astigmatica, Strain CCMP880" /LENGTH=640 /DNA_ID=CAMNT_0005495047 /DNA_START=272 /DNA_END=2195 /DNA_ORIENTATION=+
MAEPDKRTSFFTGCFAPPLDAAETQLKPEEEYNEAQSQPHSSALFGCLASFAIESGESPSPSSGSPTRGSRLDESPRSLDSASGTPDCKPKTHLMMLVNGLGGSHKDWAGLRKVMGQSTGLDHMLLHPSPVNAGKRSTDGIDVCGERLANEIRMIVSQVPELESISFIGHSLGGLMSRYAVGLLYDKERGLVGGLAPKHFITIASPHLGCDKDGDAQVPLLTWVGAIPVVGHAAGKAAKSVAGSVTGSLFGRSGKQLFLKDSDPENGELPIVELLTLDAPGKPPFFSALAAFSSRTVYANSWGDVLVGWANSSLRFLHQLPAARDLTPGQLHSQPAHQTVFQPVALALGSPDQMHGGTGHEAGISAAVSTSLVGTREECDAPGQQLALSNAESSSSGYGDAVHGAPELERPDSIARPDGRPTMGAPVTINCETQGSAGPERRTAGDSEAQDIQQRRCHDAVSPANAGGISSRQSVDPEPGPRSSEQQPGAHARARSAEDTGRNSAASLQSSASQQTPQSLAEMAASRGEDIRSGHSEQDLSLPTNPPTLPAEAQGEAAQPTACRRFHIKHANRRTQAMLTQLQRLSWNRVDVTFKSAFQAFDSHNHIKAAKNKGEQNTLSRYLSTSSKGTSVAMMAMRLA